MKKKISADISAAIIINTEGLVIDIRKAEGK